jgi:hypothetical protein
VRVGVVLSYAHFELFGCADILQLRCCHEQAEIATLRERL